MIDFKDTASVLKMYRSKEALAEEVNQNDFENNMESLDQLIEEGLDIAYLGGGREW